jgi:two-component system sensor kinase FixL
MPPSLRSIKKFRRGAKRADRRDKRPRLGAAGELQALMDAAVDAIVVINASGTIERFNAAAERLFGYGENEIVGQPVNLLMPEPHRSRHHEYMRRYHATNEARIIGIGREMQACRKDGTVFPVWLTVGETRSPVGRRYVGFVRDLTSQREIEAERYALETRLAHVGRFSLMGEMAAGIAHEINQPLSAIANYSQAAKHLLEGGDVEPESLMTACSGIAEQAQRAGEVIGNLRNFIRKREVRKELIDINDVMRGAMGLVAVDASDSGVNVVTEFGAHLPQIYGNVVQLQQVLLNLTRNAIDATTMRSGTRAGLVTIRTFEDDDGAVVFEVGDNGPGVSPQLAESIFHPFVTTKLEGLGVGLAISRTIVSAHGGRLTYRDNPKGGAIFSVLLPAANEADTE